jgi:hypothetical protein
MKKLILSIFVTTLFTIPSFAEPAPYQDICKVKKTYLCDYKGKKVYLRTDKKKTVLGKIIAVTWKQIGDPVEINPDLTSTQSGYYYVIAPTAQKSDRIIISANLVNVIQ